MFNISKLVLGNTSFNFYNISKKLLKLYILEMLLFTIVIILTVTNVIGLNLSIDFTGGTLYEVENINSQALDAISEFSSDLELSVTRYESINDGDYYRFRTVEGSIEDENTVLNQISTFFGAPKSEIDFQRVGPTFGTEISNQGVRALLIFIAFIASIISIRYQFRFAIIAIIALVHDLLMCVCIYILTGIEVTPATIIAVLTVLGYSLYDTVVIFDKIKDNSAKIKESSISVTVMNSTFNEVIMRSINTSITSIIPVASLILVGNYLGLQGALTDFAIPLLIGMFSGTYSSIFVTAPFISRLLTNK
tara:strand:- start:283 stop:1203 length:921 start_codon:yes stop_codon:yes gene_type:complete